MIILSCRPQERIFPIISVNLYKLNPNQGELTADQKVGYNLLALAQQKISGRHLDVLGQFGRLLRQHQMAMEAELASKWQRADFFWRQVQIEFKTLSKQHEVWQKLAEAVANYPQVGVMNDPTNLRQRLLHELFIDTHCAFYNGLIPKTTQPSWKERAFVHIDYIQQLLDLSSIFAEEVKTLLGEAWQTRITACKEAKKWRQAIDYCQQRLKWLPNDIEFQGELAEIHYLATLARCWDAETKKQYSQNVKTLQGGIQKLEKCIKKYPHSLTIFQLLGSLYHLRAKSLVKSHQLFDAFLSIQKAITYHPHLTKAYKARHELLELKNQLQSEMESGVPSGWDGFRLLADANKGFARMNKYIDSEEAKKTARAFQVAEAIHLWHKIGLPEPREGWVSTKTALQLWEAVNSVLQHPPQTKAKVQNAWEAVVESKPDLAELNSARICGYLEHNLFGEESDRVLVTPPTGHSESPPILTPASTRPQLSTEPFIPWLFSAQDKRIKLQAILASILFITTGYIATREQTGFAGRQKAYEMILAAKQVQNDEAVLKASKEFFYNASLLGRDERTPQVIEIYEESLVRWFGQQPGEQINAENQEYLDLYSQLQKTANTEEN